MGSISDIYNKVITYVGEEIIYPVMRTRYSDAQLATRPEDSFALHLFHNLADSGQSTHQLYNDGKILAGAANANLGFATAPFSATKQTVVDLFNHSVKNGFWNNAIAALTSLMIGNIVGTAAGGGFTGLGLTLASGVLGWFYGDEIMDKVGTNLEKIPVLVPS